MTTRNKENAMTTQNKVRFPKIKSASVSYGDRAAEFRTSARYAVEVDGERLPLEIRNQGAGGYMDVSRWVLLEPAKNWRQVGVERRTLRELKDWIRKSVNEDGSGFVAARDARLA